MLIKKGNLFQFLRSQSWLICLFIISFCLSFFYPISTYSQSSQSEIRGVWLTNIDSEILFSAENTKNAIANLAELNFNTLYPTVELGIYSLS